MPSASIHWPWRRLWCTRGRYSHGPFPCIIIVNTSLQMPLYPETWPFTAHHNNFIFSLRDWLFRSVIRYIRYIIISLLACRCRWLQNVFVQKKIKSNELQYFFLIFCRYETLRCQAKFDKSGIKVSQKIGRAEDFLKKPIKPFELFVHFFW